MKVKVDHIYLFKNHPGGRLFTEQDARFSVTSRQVPNVVERVEEVCSRQHWTWFVVKRGGEVGPRIAIRPEWSAGMRECPRKLLYPMS